MSAQERRRWSLKFKSFTSWNKGDKVAKPAFVLDSIPEAQEIKFPTPSQELSGFVLVVPDRIHRDKREEIIKEFFEEHCNSEGFELYPSSSTRKVDFKNRFGDQVFEANVLHKLHPNGKRYLPVLQYTGLIDTEKMQEALYVLGDLGAYWILINKNMYNKVKDGVGREVTLELPEAVPMAGGMGGSLGVEGNMGNSQTSSTMVMARFEKPSFKPHFKEGTHWFYDNGLQHSTIKELVRKAKSGSSVGLERELAFSTKDEHSRLHDLQAKLGTIIGVAVKAEHSELSEFEYSFKVKFFEKEDLECLDDFITSDSSRLIREARISLSELASMRAAHFTDRHIYREDILFAGGNEAPIEEWVQSYSESTWKEWWNCQADSNVFTIPLVLYGESGTDNSIALLTWDAAVRASPYTYHTEWTLRWEKMVGHPRAKYESFFQKIRFDPNAGQAFAGDPAVFTEERYNEFREKDKVRLLLRDTFDANDLYTDTRGVDFPFGLRVLVLDATAISKLINHSTGNVKIDPDTTAKVERLEKLLGPNRDKNVKTLNRYPPIAALLTKCNDMAPPFVEKLIAFVKSMFRITNVFKMPTFEPPTEEQAHQYADDPEFREKFDKE